jgi:hypothetical protein
MYLSVKRAAISNRRVENRGVADQEPVDTFSLNKRRNPKRGVLQQVILSPLDIRRDPVPGYRVSD